jgi:hypothetical protein
MVLHIRVATLRCRRVYKFLAPAFFLAAQRAFMRAANFFRAAGLIGLRAGFVAGTLAFFSAGLPFRFAQARLIAKPIRLRAAGDIVRLRVADLGGRPTRGLDPSRAAIARLSRARSVVSAATIWAMSM